MHPHTHLMASCTSQLGVHFQKMPPCPDLGIEHNRLLHMWSEGRREDAVNVVRCVCEDS